MALPSASCPHRALFLLAWLTVVAPDVRAQTPSTPTGPGNELRTVTDQLQRSEAEQSRLRSEIAGLKGDRTKLSAELLKTTEAVRAAETRVTDSQARLDEVSASEAALQRSLEARRETTAEVLAALQRMGRRSPPAVVVHPEDMLEAIRSAILLGYVIPEIRAEAETLVADLGALVRLREAAAAERQRLARERDTIAGERTRLSALIEARQGQIETSEKALVEERGRIEALGKQAQSLRDLIARAESDAAALRRAEEQAAKVPLPARSPQELAALSQSAFKDPARLQPKIAFTDARGLLALPTNGPIVKAFGAADGFGGTERGITIAAAAGNIVTAPVDGWILFAGPYRSYGRILIINAGNGYNFVLTGLRDTSVEIGQFVLAGEPVGAMGALTVEEGTGATASPALYVELRKDNQPIDPTPWWAKNMSEKARG
ncbi:MAG: peptidoglycan DD-metalloendopeptidase family protein [Proteobacteria bacterium]|nr:peptidoglycan DD-metalloendopeptidase family protein [Pseudomonadota bacterium]